VLRQARLVAGDLSAPAPRALLVPLGAETLRLPLQVGKGWNGTIRPFENMEKTMEKNIEMVDLSHRNCDFYGFFFGIHRVRSVRFGSCDWMKPEVYWNLFFPGRGKKT